MANVFRTDLVGGLVKSRALQAAEAAFVSGSLDQSGLEAARDAAIKDALVLQKDIGLPVVCDGELRRLDRDSLYSDAITGLRIRTAGGGVAQWQSGYCVAARLQQRKRLTEHETRYLLANTKFPFKISLLAPSALALAMFEPGVTDAVYPNLAALALAWSEVIRSELEALTREQVHYLQVSCPAYAWLYDPAARSGMSLPGQNLEAAFQELLDIDCQMFGKLSRSAATAVGLHIGRSGGADPTTDTFERMLAEVLPKVPVDRFLIEYGEPQKHDFQSLARLPLEKIAVLGLVSDTDPEDTGQIILRFDQAAAKTDERRLAISPRRGFSHDPKRTPEASMQIQRRGLERTYDAVMQIFGPEM
jgi:5-methyltetrahydropteroyltriglutamate--homocysteine methyltransferase